MSYALTLHDIPTDLYEALRADAGRLGTSMNRAAKTLLSSALGLVRPERPVYTDAFRALAGSISESEADEMRAAAADFRKIDPKDWQ